MRLDGYEFMTDAVAKFFNSIRISGWFHHPRDSLRAVRLIDRDAISVVAEVGLPHGGVQASFGPNKGFALQALRRSDLFNEVAEIEFRTRAGWRRRVRLTELCSDRVSRYGCPLLSQRFHETVNAIPGARVLDIGGRARSKVDRSQEFSVAEYVVLDVLAGENVDVVGDAHELARFFPPEHFDAIYSVAVFEHLLMPWAVVAQMSRVLKTGGIALISTHQTLGLHDMPWDFWRFSDTAWDALFNRRTGFEILERALDAEQYVVPFICRPSKYTAEKSAGFEGSAALVRKIGPCTLSWEVTTKDLITTTYPDTDDGSTGGGDYI